MKDSAAAAGVVKERSIIGCLAETIFCAWKRPGYSLLSFRVKPRHLTFFFRPPNSWTFLDSLGMTQKELDLKAENDTAGRVAIVGSLASTEVGGFHVLVRAQRPRIVM